MTTKFRVTRSKFGTFYENVAPEPETGPHVKSVYTCPGFVPLSVKAEREIARLKAELAFWEKTLVKATAEEADHALYEVYSG